MDSSTCVSRPRLQAVPKHSRSIIATAAADDLRGARRRMRHLAPWNVRPLPKMHSANGKPSEPPTSEERKQSEQLALQVLAVQMRQAAVRSALD